MQRRNFIGIWNWIPLSKCNGRSGLAADGFVVASANSTVIRSWFDTKPESVVVASLAIGRGGKPPFRFETGVPPNSIFTRSYSSWVVAAALMETTLRPCRDCRQSVKISLLLLLKVEEAMVTVQEWDGTSYE